jgi:hypothetical protein
MDRQTQVATYAGILIAAVGFLVIALAWNGAASLDYFPGQFPFLISGGMTGIGLIIVGVTIMIIQTVRRDGQERTAQLDRLAATVTELKTRMSAPDEYDPTTSGEYRPRPRRSAENGDTPTTEIPTVGSGTWQKPS